MREDCVLQHSLWRRCWCFCPPPRRAASTEGGRVRRRLALPGRITATEILATAELMETGTSAIGITEIEVTKTAAPKGALSETGSATGKLDSSSRSAEDRVTRIQAVRRVIREPGGSRFREPTAPRSCSDTREPHGSSIPELTDSSSPRVTQEQLGSRATLEQHGSKSIQERGSGRLIRAAVIRMRAMAPRPASSTGIQVRGRRGIFPNG